ncbi:MAG: DUF4126 domain-containing protein [Sphingomonas sp.]|nr:DUF4126 domain-containing protein [Sphingomonas sp.]
MIYLLAALIGVVAGLRAMTAPAALAWGAWLGCISLAATPFAFLGSIWAVGILSLLAVGELVSDQLPATPSRKVPVQFGTRLLMGGVTGAAIGAMADMLVPGLIAGMVGAVIGTYAGAAARATLARGFGRDRPAALIEDAVAIGGAALIVLALARPL